MRQIARRIWQKLGLNFGDLLIVLGIITLSVPLLWSLRSSYLQEREEREWNRQSEMQYAAPVEEPSLPPSQPTKPVWPPTKIVIDEIGLSAVVVEGKNDRDLNRGPMHLAGTSGPGETGNCCIAGHKEKWFRKLRTLEIGDDVILRTHQRDYIYIITEQKTVDPYDIGVIDQTSFPTLTLITCTGVPFGGSKHRLVLIAKLRETRKTVASGE